MSKRVRTSRIANSKKSRRSRPSGEREVAGRESLSSVDFDDARSSAPSLAPDSGPASAVEGDRPSDVGASRSASKPSAEIGAEPVVPALVTGDTPLPAPVSAEEIVPASADLTPPPAAVLETRVEAVEARADAPLASGKKKKKKGAAIGGTRPEDANASSGALSLNEPLARGFYESAPPRDAHDAHDDDEVEAARPVALSPEVLERKARLRRIVMGVFATASLVVILVAGKTLLTKNPPPAADLRDAMASAPAPTDAAPQVAEPAKPIEAEKTAAAPAPTPEASAKAEEPKPDDKKEEPKAEEKKEEAPKPSGDPAELKKTASKLYNSGKLKDAVPALRDAIAADPDDALMYLFLGDALTNTGKWPEAKEAYNQCVRTATKGPKHECSAMGGRK